MKVVCIDQGAYRTNKTANTQIKANLQVFKKSNAKDAEKGWRLVAKLNIPRNILISIGKKMQKHDIEINKIGDDECLLEYE